MVSHKILALPGLDDSFDGEGIVFCGVLTASRPAEPAGRAFHEYAKMRVTEENEKNHAGTAKKKSKKKSGSNEEADADAKNNPFDPKNASKNPPVEHAKIKNLLKEEESIYSLLEIQEGATADEIKKAYRKMVLLYHPDKAKHSSLPSSQSSQKILSLSPEAKHKRFLLIQDAWEVISDPQQRKIYDSSLPFDESVPDPKKEYTEEEFYLHFSQAFERNSRWSSKRPVPTLGDGKSSAKDVERFYSFWRNFQTWRDFSIHQEYDLKEGESREERRWMERKNRKGLEKLEKTERERIRGLVESAYGQDPRVKERLERERGEREREKREKEEKEERKREEERREKEREERERIEKEEGEKREKEREKEEREREKLQWRSVRQCIKKIYSLIDDISRYSSLPSFDYIQEFLLSAEKEQVGNFFHTLSSLLPWETPLSPLPSLLSDLTVFSVSLDSILLSSRSSPLLSSIQQSIADSFISFLQEVKSKQLSSSQQLQQQSQQILQAQAQQQAEAQQKAEWSLDELATLSKGLVKFPGGFNKRWHHIALLFNGTRTEEEVIKKSKEIANGISLNALNQKAFDQFLLSNPKTMKKLAVEPDRRDETVEGEKVEVGEKEKEEKKEEKKEKKEEKEKGEEGWNKEQQEALERGLKEFPASLGVNERWTAIAAIVPGKNKKECAARYKEIREAILKQKQTA